MEYIHKENIHGDVCKKKTYVLWLHFVTHRQEGLGDGPGQLGSGEKKKQWIPNSWSQE